MASLFAEAFIALAIICCNSLCGALDARRTVFFESHGRDDVREWASSMMKGAQYIKIDFNYQTPSSGNCLTQERVDNKTIADGCILLIHSFFATNRNYNTTGDVILFLRNPAMRPLIGMEFRDTTAPRRYFQMCLKGKPQDLCQSADGARWLRLMEGFYNEATLVIRTLSLNVEFIFDEFDSKDMPCVKDRFSSWVSTWTGDEATAKDDIGANRRFQMVNMPDDDGKWKRLATNNFYKFKSGNYSMVLWEPSDMAKVVNSVNRYLALGYAHPPGFLLAFNNDPAMFHTYTSECTRKYTHYAFGPQSMESPVATFVENPFGPNSSFMFSIGTQQNGSSFGIHLMDAPNDGHFELVQSAPLDLPKDFVAPPGSIVTLAVTLTEVEFGVIDQAGCVAYFTYQPANYSLQPNAQRKMDCIFRGYEDAQTVFAVHPTRGINTVVALRLYFKEAHLLGRFFRVDRFTTPNVSVVPMGPAFNISSSNTPVDYLPSASLQYSLNASEIVCIVTYSASRDVFAALIRLNLTDTSIQITPNSSRRVKIGVGRWPSVSLAASPSGVKFLLLYSDSFCWNSFYVNDDIFPFYPGQMVCDLNRVRTIEVLEEPVMAYLFGSIDRLEDALHTEDVPRHGIANVCDVNLIHGVYDYGYTPAAFLIPLRVPPHPLHTHWAVSLSVSLYFPYLLSECGAPLPHNGALVLDVWPLTGAKYSI